MGSRDQSALYQGSGRSSAKCWGPTLQGGPLPLFPACVGGASHWPRTFLFLASIEQALLLRFIWGSPGLAFFTPGLDSGSSHPLPSFLPFFLSLTPFGPHPKGTAACLLASPQSLVLLSFPPFSRLLSNEEGVKSRHCQGTGHAEPNFLPAFRSIAPAGFHADPVAAGRVFQPAQWQPLELLRLPFTMGKGEHTPPSPEGLVWGDYKRPKNLPFWG